MAKNSVAKTPAKTKKSNQTKKSNNLPTLQVSMTGKADLDAPALSSPDAVFRYMEDLQRSDREQLYVLHLNSKNQPIAKELVSIGSATAATVHPREVFKGAVLNGSVSIILVHNHPSGDPTPSREDKQITSRIKAAGELLGIRVVDHVVVGAGRYDNIDVESLPNSNNFSAAAEPSPGCECPDVSVDLSNIKERLDFIIQTCFTKTDSIYDQTKDSFIGLGTIIWDIKRETERIYEKLYPADRRLSDLVSALEGADSEAEKMDIFAKFNDRIAKNQ